MATIAELRARYEAALHGMQTAVAFEMHTLIKGSGTDPKHLRVGVNSAMISDAAAHGLLIKKGIFTEEEYMAALAEAAEAELARYEALYPTIKFR